MVARDRRLGETHRPTPLAQSWVVRGPGGEGSLLTASQLLQRRTEWRRRRARRRALAGVLIGGALTLTALVLLASGPGSGGHAGRPGAPARMPEVTSAGRVPVAGAKSTSAAHNTVLAPDRAVDRLLDVTSYVRLGGVHQREVALTFDDGPSPYTPALLAILRRMHAAATFFVIGRWASAYPEIVRSEARDGFEIADHTETHPMMAQLTPALQQTQIEDGASAIRRAGAPYPRLWRPPYGSFNTATLQILRRLRMLMVLWSADTSDYTRPGVKRIIYVAVSGAQPGAIILMHDGGGNRSETVAALPRIIVRFASAGTGS